MTDQRKVLNEQALQIKNATEPGSNTAEIVGGHLEAMVAAAVLVPQDGARTYWLDGDNGNDDTGDGSQALPWATFAKVVDVIGKDIEHNVHLRVQPATNPYSTDALFTDRALRGFLHIEGEGHEEVVGATAIDSHSGVVIDLSTADPQWTEDEYRGLHVELDDGAGNKFYSTIARNTDNTIYMCAPKTFNMAASATIRIVRPAVKLRPTAVWRGDSPNCEGGPARAFYSRAAAGMLWHNLELNSADGDYNTYYMTGSHLFVGFIVSGNAPFFGQTLRVIDGNFWSGKWERTGNYLDDLGITDNDQTGWGISMVDPDLNYPGVMVIEQSYFQGSYVGGPVLFQNGSLCEFSDGYRFTTADTYDDYIEWPYKGCITAEQSCTVRLLSFTYASNGEQYGALSGPADDLPMMYAEEGCIVEALGPPTIEMFGIGDVAHASGGHIKIEPTANFPTGGATKVMRATRGGTVELASDGAHEFAAYGDAIASAVNPLTRPATDGNWAVNESTSDKAASFSDLPKDGGSAVFRTS